MHQLFLVFVLVHVLCSYRSARTWVIAEEKMLLPQPFPVTKNPAAPDPSALWSPTLTKGPLPTNTGWLNFVLNEGSCPEYLHPYLIQSKDGALSICYPSTRIGPPIFVAQVFVANITISGGNAPPGKHIVTYFDDLSVTLELPGPMTVPLVRGCPYITCVFDDYVTPQISTIHAVLDVKPNSNRTKHKVLMNNGQTWLIYSSDYLALSSNLTVNGQFKGFIRIVLLTGDDSIEAILDSFSSTYPVQGHADLSVPFQVKYEWKKCGSGDLLMLSLPMHRDIMSSPSVDQSCSALSYNGIDGKMQGVVSDCWVLNESSLAVGWYSLKGISNQRSILEIGYVLRREVGELMPITNDSTYFHGKALARAARMGIIADEIGCLDVLNKVRTFLRESLTPWMEGGFSGNALIYDEKWGGLVSRNGSQNFHADFGLGVYNDHHYHMGYFCYAGAVLAKLDPTWGRAYRAHLYTIVEDYMTFHHPHIRQTNVHTHQHSHHHHSAVTRSKPLFPRLRNFDLWVLHSWAGGLTEFADGRNQESTSEAVNAYYSAALLGLAFGDGHLINAGLTLTALEIRAAQALWHVPSSCTLYEPEFVALNRVVGVLWANKRDTGLWFAAPESRECRLGIQLLPILPITEVLFQNIDFVQELVEWAMPSLGRADVTDGWKGFVYALQALYEPEKAFKNIMALSEHDDGNSLSNLLWWIHSRWSRS